MPLEPPDQQHWQAAAGYVELGMFLEADTELDGVMFEAMSCAYRVAVRSGDIVPEPGRQFYIFPSQPYSRTEYRVPAVWLDPVI